MTRRATPELKEEGNRARKAAKNKMKKDTCQSRSKELDAGEGPQSAVIIRTHCCFYVRRGWCRFRYGCRFIHQGWYTRRGKFFGPWAVHCERCEEGHEKYQCEHHYRYSHHIRDAAERIDYQ